MDDEDEKSPESFNTPQNRNLKVCDFSSLYLNNFHISIFWYFTKSYLNYICRISYYYFFLNWRCDFCLRIFIAQKCKLPIKFFFSIWCYFIAFEIKKAFTINRINSYMQHWICLPLHVSFLSILLFFKITFAMLTRAKLLSNFLLDSKCV